MTGQMKRAAVANLIAGLAASSAGAHAAQTGLPPAAAGQLRATITDSVVQDAIRQTLAKAPEKHPQDSTALSGDKYRDFARQLDKAVVPSCFGPDALKHQPTTIEVGGWEIGTDSSNVNNILAKPFILLAALRGKCQ